MYYYTHSFVSQSKFESPKYFLGFGNIYLDFDIRTNFLQLSVPELPKNKNQSIK